MADPKSPKAQVPSPLAPITRKSLKSGLICEGAVSENERPETSVMAVENFHFDAIGCATLRKGVVRWNTDVGNFPSAVTGLHQYIDVPGNHANDNCFAADGSGNMYAENDTGNDFDVITSGLTPGGPQSKSRFVTFLDEVFAVNGGNQMLLWTKSSPTFNTNTGDVTAAPTGTQFVEVFQSRVWTMGDPTYPSRLYYSSVPSATTTPGITWNTDVTTGTWIDVSPQDGDFPTALQRFRNQLLVFKTNRIYRVFGIGQVDADPWYGVGTSSQESVIETKAGVFFHHSTGFYQYNVYGVVQEISKPVIDFIRAIPASQYPYVAGYLELDGDHIVWSIGDVYVTSPWQSGTSNNEDESPVPDGEFGGGRVTFYHNCELRYTISTQVWTVYTKKYLMTTAIRRHPLMTYSAGFFETNLVGSQFGNLYNPDFGNFDYGDDNTNDGTINYSLTHGWESLDGLNSTRITIQNITFAHTGGAGTNVNYQTDVNDPGALSDWTKRVGNGHLVDKYTVFTSANIKGRKMRLRLSGKSIGAPFIYNGYEVIDAMAEFYNFPSN